jgi:hypothetical protein
MVIKANQDKMAWGIREVIMHVMNCHTSCVNCTGPL